MKIAFILFIFACSLTQVSSLPIAYKADLLSSNLPRSSGIPEYNTQERGDLDVQYDDDEALAVVGRAKDLGIKFTDMDPEELRKLLTSSDPKDLDTVKKNGGREACETVLAEKKRKKESWEKPRGLIGLLVKAFRSLTKTNHGA